MDEYITMCMAGCFRKLQHSNSKCFQTFQTSIHAKKGQEKTWTNIYSFPQKLWCILHEAHAIYLASSLPTPNIVRLKSQKHLKSSPIHTTLLKNIPHTHLVHAKHVQIVICSTAKNGKHRLWHFFMPNPHRQAKKRRKFRLAESNLGN